MVNDGPGLNMRLRMEAARISNQHEKLDQLYSDVRDQIQRQAWPEVRVVFGQLRESLEAHFEMEESVYFPAVHGFEPKRGRLLSSLSNAHRGFSTELGKISGLLQASHLEKFERQLEQLVKRLLDHERQEDELLGDIRRAASEDVPPRPPAE